MNHSVTNLFICRFDLPLILKIYYRSGSVTRDNSTSKVYCQLEHESIG